MGNMRKKHLKSGTTKASAILVSFVIHAVLAVVALFFVAVSVVVKGETEFVAKPVERPNMQLRKLQVPVNVKSTPRPKLRRQIVAAPKINHSIAIQLPEIVGVAGGIGSGRSGLGGGASLGFTMPEIEFFGVKSQGERLFFVLDASDHMMVDEIGGVRSYEIIKAELIRILRELNSVVLFNVAVYEDLFCQNDFPADGSGKFRKRGSGGRVAGTAEFVYNGSQYAAAIWGKDDRAGRLRNQSGRSG